MKKANDEHVGLRLNLKNGERSRILSVSSFGYRVKIISTGEKIVIPLEEIKCTVLGDVVKLFQKRPVDLIGHICQLQNCGPNIDGLLVKVVGKDEQHWRFLYATGTGGTSPERCLVKLTKETVLDKSWEIKFTDEKDILNCNCCGKPFKTKNLELFFIPLREWHKQGVICKQCLSVVRPFFNLVKARPEEEHTRVGAHALKDFSVSELMELNAAVITSASELADRHAINAKLIHQLIRPTAMEYIVTYTLPNDVSPEQLEEIKKSALKNAKTLKTKRGKV